MYGLSLFYLFFVTTGDLRQFLGHLKKIQSNWTKKGDKVCTTYITKKQRSLNVLVDNWAIPTDFTFLHLDPNFW